MAIIVGIVIFSVIILIHEFGHYFAAVKSGVAVEEFSLGMGAALFQKTYKGTTYSIRLFPVGGYCKMPGMDEESANENAFCNKSVGIRLIIIVAGAFMNFVLAVLIFFLLNISNGVPLSSVRQVIPNTPAERAELAAGDKIVKINNAPVHTYNDFAYNLDKMTDKPFELTIIRDGKRLTKTIAAEQTTLENGAQTYMIGIYRDFRTGLFEKNSEYAKTNIFQAGADSFWKLRFWTVATFEGLGRIFTGQFKLNDMGGAIRIVQTIGTVYEQTAEETSGFKEFVAQLQTMATFCAILSTNIGIFNVLPLPALDGGRAVFLLIEWVRRKPLDPDKEGVVHFVGFVLLIAFSIVVAINDIRNII
ncbi:zinc metalloprotease [Clostridia bacterium]|nr:zinc metalloprotease [Clostridia bacterium]